LKSKTPSALLSVCNVVNLKKDCDGKLFTPPKAALDVVGMDIGYGEGVSVGVRDQTQAWWL
jgi:hypothetical protein